MQHVNEGKIGNIYECFVIGEIIKVEKNLEVAVEIALGGNISHIITKDESVAEILISYLKINNLGRATFLPLNIIKGKRLIIDNKTKNNLGYIGIASELIGYDEKFSEVMAFILGRTIICKDMDSALEIAKINNFRFKIVTISGEVINVGGSLTGGSVYSKTSSIVGRKREIKDLAKNLQTLKNELSIKLEKIKQSKFEIVKLDQEDIILMDKVNFDNIELTKLEAKINAIINETNRLKNNIQKLKTEKFSEDNKIKQEINEIEEKKYIS